MGAFRHRSDTATSDRTECPRLGVAASRVPTRKARYPATEEYVHARWRKYCSHPTARLWQFRYPRSPRNRRSIFSGRDFRTSFQVCALLPNATYITSGRAVAEAHRRPHRDFRSPIRRPPARCSRPVYRYRWANARTVRRVMPGAWSGLVRCLNYQCAPRFSRTPKTGVRQRHYAVTGSATNRSAPIPYTLRAWYISLRRPSGLRRVR